jgi:hypothetical protein
MPGVQKIDVLLHQGSGFDGSHQQIHSSIVRSLTGQYVAPKCRSESLILLSGRDWSCCNGSFSKSEYLAFALEGGISEEVHYIYINVHVSKIQPANPNQSATLNASNANIHPSIPPVPPLPQNSLLSPILQVSNTPSSRPFHFAASFNIRGGSSTSSSVRTHVPQ